MLLTKVHTCRFRLLTQRKPNVTQEWKEKLPDFVKRLEEALYQGAGSKVSTVGHFECLVCQASRKFTTIGGAGGICKHQHARAASTKRCSHFCILTRTATRFATTVEAGLSRVVSADASHQRFYRKHCSKRFPSVLRSWQCHSWTAAAAAAVSAPAPAPAATTASPTAAEASLSNKFCSAAGSVAV